jgi:hypothetical protein
MTDWTDPYADIPPSDVAPDGEPILTDGQVPDLRLIHGGTEVPTGGQPQNLTQQIRDRLQDGGSVLDIPDEIPAVWGKATDIFWAEGEALLLVGPPGVGKTTLTGQIVRARVGIGDGIVLGQPVAPGRKRVLYLAMDRPSQIKRSLRRQFTEADREVLDQRLRVWPGPPLADMAKDTGLFLDMCRAAEADTVIVDSLKDAAIGLSDDAVGAGWNRSRQEALQGGVQTMELHHNRKAGTNGGEPNTLADVYGSTWITAGVGSVICLWGDAGDPVVKVICLWGDAGDPVVKLIHLKPPADALGPYQILHDAPSGISSIVYSLDLVDLARQCRDGLTVDMAAANMFPGTDKHPRPSKSEVERARRRLDGLTTGEHPMLRRVDACKPKPARYFAVTRRPEGQLFDEAGS